MGGVLSWVQDYWQGDIFVAILGLDGAGKSALVHRLQYKDTEEPLPTMGFFVHTMRIQNTLLKVADVAGQDAMRNLWSVMYHRAEGIIYVIDGNDYARLPLAISELKKVMAYPSLEGKPFLILVNKHDLNAFDASLVKKDLAPGVWRVFNVSVKSGDGIQEAVTWFHANVST